MVWLLWILLSHADFRRVGMANSIIDNNPANWSYGCVFLSLFLLLPSSIFGFIYEARTQITSTTG